MQENNIDYIKSQLDILSVAEAYGELEKSGSDYRYKHDHSIVISPRKQIFSNFNGEISGGDVINLIAYMEKISNSDAIQKAKSLIGLETYKITPQKQKHQKEKKEVDFQKIGFFASLHLKAIKEKNFIPARIEQKDKTFKDFILLPDEYHKLFETNSLPAEFEKKLEYLKDKILGFDTFYNCPSIIIRDYTGRVVDLISYRPIKPKNYENWSNPKYIYKNKSNRGEAFLFPFQKEFEAIIKKQTTERFFIVGEGIKNGLNALLYSTPYISLESSSDKMSNKIKSYIVALIDKGYALITMFDGDKAGEKAYKKFIDDTGLKVENFFDFSSGIDFVEYMQGGENE